MMIDDGDDDHDEKHFDMFVACAAGIVLYSNSSSDTHACCTVFPCSFICAVSHSSHLETPGSPRKLPSLTVRVAWLDEESRKANKGGDLW